MPRSRVYTPPLVPQLPMDNSCIIDMERVRYAPSNLEDDMRNKVTSYLTMHYPEYTFDHVFGKKPRGHDVVVAFRGGWRVADWRKA